MPVPTVSLLSRLFFLLLFAWLAPGAGAQDLSGRWLDSNGDLIQIQTTGSGFTATPISEGLAKWWIKGEARVTGKTISITFRSASRIVDMDSGTVTSATRIDWGNGSNWQKEVPKEAAIPDTPVALFPETYTVPVTLAARYVAGKVTFFNEGGYFARFSLSYYADGRRHRYDTGTLAFKARQQHVAIPLGAENIVVKGEYWAPFEWYPIFTERFPKLSQATSEGEVMELGYKTFGPVGAAEWNHDVEPWVPVFSGNVHVTNAAGKRIYVGYCTDLGWSAANGLAGVMMGLVDTLRSADPNAVRFFALALSLGIELPADVIECFRDVSVELAPSEAKMVVSTGFVETCEAFFSIFSDGWQAVVELWGDELTEEADTPGRNVQMNPVILAAGVFGARTLNLVIFNEDLSMYWIVPTSQDESWIIEEGRARLAKHGTLRTPAEGGRSYPGIATGYSIPPQASTSTVTPRQGFGSVKLWAKNFGTSQGWTKESHVRCLADVNGDGLQDIVGFGGAGVLVARSTGSSFEDAKLALAEFGSGSGWNPSWTRTMADVDGDGRADIVAFPPAGPRVALARGDGFEASTQWSYEYDASKDGWALQPGPRRFGSKWPGDGYESLWSFTPDGVAVWEPVAEQKVFRISSYSGKSRFDKSIIPAWGPNAASPFVADLNGDGHADPAAVLGGMVLTARSINYNPISPTPRIQIFQLPGYDQGFGDVNGDGRADHVLFGKPGVEVRLSKLGPVDVSAPPLPLTGFEGPVQALANFGLDSGWTRDGTVRLLGDVNGDEKADIVGFSGPGTFVALSEW